MAENKTDLVREIEKALGIMEEHQARLHAEKEVHGWETHAKQAITHAEGAIILSTLQRAREALRWIPCEERLPERNGTLRSYRCMTEFSPYPIEVYWNDGGWSASGVKAWIENPPAYTPPEEVEK